MHAPRESARYDVVILGGGPAGTATALALKQRYPALSIAIVERSVYGTLRIGETLPPNVQPLLSQLGVWDAFVKAEHLAAYGMSAVWGDAVSYDNDFIFSPYGRGWHLDRRQFDLMLARQAVQKGSILYLMTRVMKCEQLDGSVWSLTLRTQTKPPFTIEAAFVVDATGRLATFARQQAVQKIRFDQLMGIFVYFFDSTTRLMRDTYTLVEAWEEGWWYSALLPNRYIVVGCMSDADIIKTHRLKQPEQWFKCLDQAEETRRRVERATPYTSLSIHAAHTQCLDRFTGQGWLAVGDAAMAFDPLSSQGIYKALLSGIEATGAIGASLEGSHLELEQYAAHTKQQFETYLDTKANYYRQEQRWPLSPFWQRRHEFIDLHPQSILYYACPTAVDLGTFRMYLSVSDFKLLCNLCHSGRAAHEVIAAFKTQSTNDIPDHRIILVLQYLIHHKVIAINEEKTV